MSLPLIYIAGPFRGPTPWDVEQNIRRAEVVGLQIAACGGYPVIPHSMTRYFDKQLTDQFWLDGTMALLVRCDAIFLCRQWQRSTGATAEAERVRNVLPVFHEDLEGWPDLLSRWIAAWKGNRL